MNRMMMAIATACLLVGTSLLRAEPGEMMPNGGFEKGMTGWMWEEWRGLPVPGYLDREDAADGQASFKMTLPGKEGSRYITHAITGEASSSKAYTFGISLSAKDLPPGSVTVRLLMFGLEKPDDKGKATPQGWVEIPPKSGVNSLITLGGTQDWKSYTVDIPAGAIKPKTTSLRVIITHSQIGTGVLGVDKVSFTEKAATAAVTPAPDAQAQGFKVMTYDPAEAAVLKPVGSSVIAWALTPDKTFYRPDALPEIQLKIVPAPDTQVSWQMIDGFGNVIDQQSKPADTSSLKIALPANHGYYELVARATQQGKTIAEVRRSMGVLSPPASTETPEPFGFWVGGTTADYQELGVRWARVALYHDLYRKDPEGYLKQIRERIEASHKAGIKVLMYPKDHPREFSLSQKVFKDTPEAWASVEDYWKAIVRGLKGHTDAWGVINEPYRGMWDGTDDLIIRYWALMRRAIDQEDPQTPLIGPSLNINEPSMMSQYQDLLTRGYGQLINGVELHTYTATAMPEDIDWESKITHARNITRQATGRDLPVWSTEMGVTVPYTNELFQAQYLMRCFLWAKKMDLRMVMWHMGSWPAGAPQSEREYATFRQSVAASVAQPRPAGVAYGVMTRQLAGAQYRTQLDFLGAATRAFVFERRGEAFIALWRTSGPASVRVPVQVPSVSVTDLFGRTQSRPTEDGILTIDAGPSVQFVGPVSRQLLSTQPLIQAASTRILPGGNGTATAVISNPTSASAKVALRWMADNDWSVTPATHEETLQPREQRTLTLTIKAPLEAATGAAVLYARTRLNDSPAGIASLPLDVLPRAQIVSVTPVFSHDAPAVRMTIQRHDPALKQLTLSADKKQQTIQFSSESTQSCILPIENAAADALRDFAFSLRDEKRQLDHTRQRLSFVKAIHATKAVTIDGNPSDWPEVAGAPVERFVVAWRWDSQHVYLLVRARDAQHVQRQKSDGLWMDDSIQIGLAANRTEDLIRRWVAEMAETHYTELGVALKSDAPMMYRYATLNREFAPLGDVTAQQIQSAIRRDNDITTYEVRMPIQQLGLKPLSAGQVLRGSVAINRNDGGRRTFWEWFGGITNTKQPMDYGHLILAE